ncbi:MAG TPA: hypothetical protein VN520_03360 [Streptomyces sp.]|uniref:hypothetical protein n=1 Tax=Streptomyces sp. TaxID=1931 RepID=UPI002D1193FD|nr:hypothetical protein [Streptomyces sp.]HWU05434.1 hypothetical protein [Streptomyces sp.]
MYRYAEGSEPGDADGQGPGGTWSAAPAGMEAALNADGPSATDIAGLPFRKESDSPPSTARPASSSSRPGAGPFTPAPMTRSRGTPTAEVPGEHGARPHPDEAPNSTRDTPAVPVRRRMCTCSDGSAAHASGV